MVNRSKIRRNLTKYDRTEFYIYLMARAVFEHCFAADRMNLVAFWNVVCDACRGLVNFWARGLTRRDSTPYQSATPNYINQLIIIYFYNTLID